MKTIELFSGTKSFSKVMELHGHDTFTIDNEFMLFPDLVTNILTLVDDSFPPCDVIWASPPCQGFSVAAIGKNWDGGPKGYIPKSESAKLGIALVKKTIAIMGASKPKWWFIENPRGLLRKMFFMDGLTRHTITYCQYGDDRMKPTDIWTNATWWKPKPPCKNGMKCHVSAPRGSKTGTQGIKGARDRGKIPSQLFEEILNQMPK